jgi:translocator protein
MKNLSKFIIAIVVCELAGAIGSVFTMPAIPGWYAGLAKSALTPPAWVFGPVWTGLFTLIGISLFLVSRNDWRVRNPLWQNGRKAWNPWSERLWTGDLQKFNVIAIFVAQYILNITWSYLFFGLRFPGLAFAELITLWIAIVYTAINFYRISKPAAWLLLPYLVWVSFAGYLDIFVFLHN